MDIVQQIRHNLVKHYQIKNPLGEGGSGTNYEAIDLKTHQRVALKALSLQGMNGNSWNYLNENRTDARGAKNKGDASISRLKTHY